MAALENKDRLLWVDSVSERPLLVALPYGQCRACGTWLGKWSLPAARRSLSHKTYVELSWGKPALAAAPVVVLHISNKSTFGKADRLVASDDEMVECFNIHERECLLKRSRQQFVGPTW